jgi:hypothetical protein
VKIVRFRLNTSTYASITVLGCLSLAVKTKSPVKSGACLVIVTLLTFGLVIVREIWKCVAMAYWLNFYGNKESDGRGRELETLAVNAANIHHNNAVAKHYLPVRPRHFKSRRPPRVVLPHGEVAELSCLREVAVPISGYASPRSINPMPS